MFSALALNTDGQWYLSLRKFNRAPKTTIMLERRSKYPVLIRRTNSTFVGAYDLVDYGWRVWSSCCVPYIFARLLQGSYGGYKTSLVDGRVDRLDGGSKLD